MDSFRIAWTCRNAVKTALLVVMVTNLGTLVTAQTSCGTLRSSFSGTTARIRMYPDPELAKKKALMYGRTYRWMKSKDGAYTEVGLEVGRITEANFTLNIKDFTGAVDAGTYYVQCRSLSGQVIESQRLYVTRADVTPSLMSPTTSKHTTLEHTTSREIGETTVRDKDSDPFGQSTKKATEGIDSSIAIVVVSLCIVIIVVVISCTVVLVCRRRKRKTEDHQRLADITESSMACRAEGDGESVYNEIDVKYEDSKFKSKVKDLSGSREHLSSPTLPRRPVTAGQQGPVSEKSTANVISSRSGAVKDNEYATVAVLEKQSKPDPTLTVDVKSMYASVVPKKYRINKDVALPPEYINAKPVLRKNGILNEQMTDLEGYTVMFPKIDISTINTKMEDKGRANLVSMTEENFEAVVKSRVYRSEKRKSSKKRELNYIEIDHSGKESDDALVRDFVKAPPEKMEYSSIDFEKKAFVAPKRRPPSSWYKRRNKKKIY